MLIKENSSKETKQFEDKEEKLQEFLNSISRVKIQKWQILVNLRVGNSLTITTIAFADSSVDLNCIQRVISIEFYEKTF